MAPVSTARRVISEKIVDPKGASLAEGPVLSFSRSGVRVAAGDIGGERSFDTSST
jgi:hypothetical protein